MLVGTQILMNSKCDLYEYMYRILPNLFKKENITFCFRDKDSIAFKIDSCTYKQYLEIEKNNKQYFNNEMGGVKNELDENINEIISLRSKCLSIQRLSDINCKKDLNHELRKSKGINNNYRKKFHNHKLYQDVLFNKIKQQKCEYYKIVNRNRCLLTQLELKDDINNFNDKMYMIDKLTSKPHVINI